MIKNGYAYKLFSLSKTQKKIFSKTLTKWINTKSCGKKLSLDICVVKLNTATYQVIIARNNSEIL
jgi:hypothetical protein